MKQMEVKPKEIGGKMFYIKPFPAFTAANLSGELAAVIAPLLGSLIPLFGNDSGEEKQEKKNIMDTDVNDALPGLASAFSTLSGDKFEDIMKKLLINSKNISYEDNNGNVKVMTYDDANEIFCMDIDEMYMLCFEVIKINFGGFFKKLGARSGNLREIIQKVAPSTASTET